MVNQCHGAVSTAKSNPKLSTLWDTDTQNAFDTLKDKLVTAPVLGYADFTCPFILETDASGQGLGAILCQQQGDRKRVIAYASRRL